MKKLAFIFTLLGISLSLGACGNSGPTKLTAPSISISEDTISWAKINNASKYSVYQNNEFLSNVLTNSFEISVSESGDYKFYVIAKGDNKTYLDSDKSNEITYHYEKKQTLTAPVASLNNRTISWNAVSNATYYYVNLNNMFVANVTGLTYEVPEHPAGGYTYTIQACNNKEISPMSNKVVYQNTTGITLNTKTQFSRQELIDEWRVTSGKIDTDVTEGYDLTPNTISSVYTSITNENRYLVLSARAFVREGEIAPELFVKVDGDIVYEESSSKEYVSPYSDEPIEYAYDLSAYVGKNVFLSLEQRSGTHCCITDLKLIKEYGPQLARYYEWSKTELRYDWLVSGCSDLSEGVDFKSNGKAEIKLNVREATSKITVQLRMFVGQDTEDAKWYLKVNGTQIPAVGHTENYILVDHTTDSEQTFSYDLSSYNGKVVRITMGSYDTTVNHCCLTACNIRGLNGEKLVSNMSEWDLTKESGLADWSIRKCNLIKEGVDLGGEGYAFVRVKITSELAYLKVNSRMFAGQDVNDAVLIVMVDEVPIVPQGATSERIVHDHTSDNTVTSQFDLSSYVGRIIAIKLYSFETDVNHLVGMNVKLMSQLEK